MAIAPSNNLRSALSQLQSRPSVQPPRPAAAGTAQGASATANTGRVQSSFAAQLSGQPIQTASSANATAPAAQPVNQPPLPVRGGYLGRHVNIVV